MFIMMPCSSKPGSLVDLSLSRLERVSEQTETPSNIFLKMFKNAAKAIHEHNPYLSRDSAKKILAFPNIVETTDDVTRQLQVKTHAEALQGKRRSMEDAYFICRMDQGTLSGVFDGHGGSEVAKYANTEFQRRFPEKLRELNGNVHSAFSALIDQIHAEVKEKPEWNPMGSTAVICFLIGSLVYTATLGDSEARNYRGDAVIPLSCVRNWASKNDTVRAVNAYISSGEYAKAIAAGAWPKSPKPKQIRYPYVSAGLNVSRAIGDVAIEDATSRKPKITVQRLYPGDFVVIACDGLWDVAQDYGVSEIVRNNRINPAEEIARYAITSGSTDNVTVVVLRIDS